MNDVPQDAWFYTREGERLGPVTFTDLRIKASEGGINPRLDMAWSQGMAEWKPAGEIDGLFERATPIETPESLAHPTDPYETPEYDPVSELMGNQGEWPGARRRSYLFAILIFPILWNIVIAMCSGLMQQQFGGELMAVITVGAMFVPFIVVIYFGIQRFANLGMSRWWFLANFVPILNLWTGYRCFACPSGYAFHKKLDGIGILLAIVYWLIFTLIVLTVAAVIAAIFGGLGSPELQQKIQDLIKNAGQETAKP
ncbi:MAG: GYF domain-containing protein [Verrucomicrobiota bacterium]